MARILVVYGSEEGQTAKVAQYIAELYRTQHHDVDLIHGKKVPSDLVLDKYDGVMVGASIHIGHHQKYMVNFAKRLHDELEGKLTAFFTVCLTAKSETPEDKAQVEEYVQNYIKATNWYPDQFACFAGAIPYTRYGFIKRFMIKRMVKSSGSTDVDTSRDYEYTDWDTVDDFADDFITAVVGDEVPVAD